MIPLKSLFPNLQVFDLSGAQKMLWDFDQKSQVVLIYEPQASQEQMQEWFSKIEGSKKLWSWLGVIFVYQKERSTDLESGVYLIDRFRHLIQHYSTSNWSLEKIEQDYIYNEASHC